MQNVYKRGDVWWLRRDPITHKRRTTGFRNKKAAILYHAERERIAADPAYAAANTATLGQWIEKTIEKKKETRATGTQHMYGVKLGHLARVFGEDTKLLDLTPAAVDHFVSQRQAEGAHNQTIHKELVCLVQLCKLARRAGCFPGDIAALRPVGFSLKYKPRERFLTRQELWRLKDHLTAEQFAWCCFAVAWACRFSEVQRARPGDWDESRQCMRIRGSKTDASSAVLPLLAMFEEEWRVAWFALQAKGSLSWPRAAHELPAACARAGIPRATPNDLRRSNASWLTEAGAQPKDTSKMLRHKTDKLVQTTYGRMRPEALRAILEDQTGTQKAQPEPVGDENSPKEAQAPWRNGRREGFKSRFPVDHQGADTENEQLASQTGARRSQSRTVTGTRRAQCLQVFELAPGCSVEVSP